MDRKEQVRIIAVCQLFDEQRKVTHECVQRYGSCKALLPAMTLVDKAMVIAYPQMLPEDRREKLLQRYRNMVEEL